FGLSCLFSAHICSYVYLQTYVFRFDFVHRVIPKALMPIEVLPLLLI
ncbi:unnamed protein product, partial [Urochloa humidicola]